MTPSLQKLFFYYLDIYKSQSEPLGPPTTEIRKAVAELKGAVRKDAVLGSGEPPRLSECQNTFLKVVVVIQNTLETALWG